MNFMPVPLDLDSDYWCRSSAPETLKQALLGGDLGSLRQWCRSNPAHLDSALIWIHSHLEDHQIILREEIAERNRLKGLEAKAADDATAQVGHDDIIKYYRISAGVSLAAVMISLAGLWYQHAQLETAQDEASKLKERVAVIEGQLAGVEGVR